MGLYDMGETKGGIFRTKKQKGIKEKNHGSCDKQTNERMDDGRITIIRRGNGRGNAEK